MRQYHSGIEVSQFFSRLRMHSDQWMSSYEKFLHKIMRINIASLKKKVSNDMLFHGISTTSTLFSWPNAIKLFLHPNQPSRGHVLRQLQQNSTVCSSIITEGQLLKIIFECTNKEQFIGWYFYTESGLDLNNCVALISEL